MTRKVSVSILAFILLAGLTLSVSANDVTKKIGFGGDLNLWPTGGGSLFLLGLNGTYGFNPNVQGELAIDLHSSARSFWGQRSILSIYPIWLSGKYVFQPPERLNPYILGGLFFIAGNIYSTGKTFRYYGQARTGLHLGGGVDYFLDDRLALNGDLRMPVGAPGFGGVKLSVGAKYFFETR